MVKELALLYKIGSMAYELKPELGPHEPRQGAYPIFIGGSTHPVDGHFLVNLNQCQDDFTIDEIVGIVHSKEELQEKMHQCALEAGRKYAEKLKCRFVDFTRTREGELVSVVGGAPSS